MRILVFSFHFGSGNASGFATSKIISELAVRGHKIIVVTGNLSEYDNNENIEIKLCSPQPLSPARVLKSLGNFVGMELNYIFWELRAKKLGEKLIKSFRPEILYGRSSPISGLSVPAKLKKKFKLPFVAHFADPIPAPVEWVSNSLERKKLLKAVLPVVENADLLSFVTNEMMEYQQTTTQFKIDFKSFISPNSISTIQSSSVLQNSGKFVFLYLGSFYGNRTPEALFRGFEIYIQEFPASEIHLYGVDKDFVERFIHSDEIRSRIKFFPKTSEPFRIMESANVLVDVDGLVERQVFLSSKFLDYLSVNRFLLTISTNDSPSSKLVDLMPNSTQRSSHNPDEIALAMKSLTLKPMQDSLFDERALVMKDYFVSEVANRIEEEFCRLNNQYM